MADHSEDCVNEVSVDAVLRKLRESFGGRVEPPQDLVATIENLIARPHMRVSIDQTGELRDLGDLAGAGAMGRSSHVLFEFGYDDPLVVQCKDDEFSGYVPNEWLGESVAIQTLVEETGLQVDEDGFFHTDRPGRGPYRIVAALGEKTDGSDWFTL